LEICVFAGTGSVWPKISGTIGHLLPTILRVNKMLSYRRETALQSALQFPPKVEDWNWETIFYGHYRSIFNHCDENLSNSVKKTQNKGYYGVQGHRGRYQSKARMRFAISD